MRLPIRVGITRGMALWLALALAPAEAVAVTLTAAGVDQAISAQLGSGLIGGSDCVGAPSCSDSRTNLGPVPLTVPTRSAVYSSIRTTAGTNSVNAEARASASIREPEEYERSATRASC